MKVYIYGLRKSGDGEFRYIGKTIRLRERFAQHKLSGKSDSYHPKDRWIASEPLVEMVVIEECDRDNWEDREKYWISCYKKEGHRLTNIHPGGTSGPGMPYTNGLLHRTNIYLTDSQYEYLIEHAEDKGVSVSHIIRQALDWHLTIQSLDDNPQVQEIKEQFPWMTTEGVLTHLVGWWREGKDYRNGNGNGQVIEMLEEILTILRGTHDTDHG